MLPEYSQEMTYEWEDYRSADHGALWGSLD